MTRILVLLIALVAMPSMADDLANSYVKLFQVQVQLAQSGNASALYSLGKMHEQGMGTPVDLDQAYNWYEKAASKGDIRAKHKLANRLSAISNAERAKKAMIAADDAKLRAHEQRVNRALTAKKRARSKALIKKQRELAEANNMEDQ